MTAGRGLVLMFAVENADAEMGGTEAPVLAPAVVPIDVDAVMRDARAPKRHRPVNEEHDQEAAVAPADARRPVRPRRAPRRYPVSEGAMKVYRDEVAKAPHFKRAAQCTLSTDEEDPNDLEYVAHVWFRCQCMPGNKKIRLTPNHSQHKMMRHWISASCIKYFKSKGVDKGAVVGYKPHQRRICVDQRPPPHVPVKPIDHLFGVLDGITTGKTHEVFKTEGDALLNGKCMFKVQKDDARNVCVVTCLICAERKKYKKTIKVGKNTANEKLAERFFRRHTRSAHHSELVERRRRNPGLHACFQRVQAPKDLAPRKLSEREQALTRQAKEYRDEIDRLRNYVNVGHCPGVHRSSLGRRRGWNSVALEYFFESGVMVECSGVQYRFLRVGEHDAVYSSSCVGMVENNSPCRKCNKVISSRPVKEAIRKRRGRAAQRDFRLVTDKNATTTGMNSGELQFRVTLLSANMVALQQCLRRHRERLAREMRIACLSTFPKNGTVAFDRLFAGGQLHAALVQLVELTKTVAGDVEGDRLLTTLGTSLVTQIRNTRVGGVQRRYDPDSKDKAVMCLLWGSPRLLRLLHNNDQSIPSVSTVRTYLRSTCIDLMFGMSDDYIRRVVVPLYREVKDGSPALKNKKIAVGTSQDETAITKALSLCQRTQSIVGFCPHSEDNACKLEGCLFHLNLDRLANKGGLANTDAFTKHMEEFAKGMATAGYVSVVMVQPIELEMPCIPAALLTSCNRFKSAYTADVDTCIMRWWAMDGGLHTVFDVLLDSASDGDARRRKVQLLAALSSTYMFADKLPTKPHRESLNKDFRLEFTIFGVWVNYDHCVVHGFMQDCFHAVKKVVNTLYSSSRALAVGQKFVDMSQLFDALKSFRDRPADGLPSLRDLMRPGRMRMDVPSAIR